MPLIDADKLKEAFAIPCYRWFSASSIYNIINAQPTAEAAPVRHGRWDKIPNSYMSLATKDGSYSGNAVSCSVCKEVNQNIYKTNYCPNCGAKMNLEG